MRSSRHGAGWQVAKRVKEFMTLLRRNNDGLALKKFMGLAVAALFLLAASGCVPPPSPNPKGWAQPAPPVPGVPELYKIDEGLYRSGNPTAEGFRNLKAMGIKTIINLRDWHSSREEVEAAGLDYVRIHMMPYLPLESVAVEFLKVAIDHRRKPVLMHCWWSSDRGGAMTAVYRVVVQGWTKDEAILEMTEGGTGYHREFLDLPFWIHQLNVERIRARVGIKAPFQKINPPARTE